MKSTIRPEDVKLIEGRSKGLQFVCDCGCVNFNYLDPEDEVWRCRNCQRVLSFDFPRLMEQALPLEEQKAPA